MSEMYEVDPYLNSIKLRSAKRMAEDQQRFPSIKRNYFPTAIEARRFMVERAEQRLTNAHYEVLAAEAALRKCQKYEVKP